MDLQKGKDRSRPGALGNKERRLVDYVVGVDFGFIVCSCFMCTIIYSRVLPHLLMKATTSSRLCVCFDWEIPLCCSVTGNSKGFIVTVM